MVRGISAFSLCRRAAGIALAVAGVLALPGTATAAPPILPIAFASLCAATPLIEAARTVAAAPVQSKAEAILGGAPSKLEMLRAGNTASIADARSAGFVLPRGCAVLPPTPGLIPMPAEQIQQRPQGFVLPMASDRPDIFGSVALGVSATPLSNRWAAVRSTGLETRRGPWASVLGRARAQDREAQLGTINAWVNARIRFTDDRATGRADQWASAAQSLRRGRGDCEDYAIAKLQMLKALGVPADDLYLVIARDLVRRADHALLVVRLNGRLVALDNETDQLLDANRANDYRPIFTYSGSRAWMHGYRVDPVRRPMQTASLEPVAFRPN
jgi:predicted transglutaminase-like cysteine proteinase